MIFFLAPSKGSRGEEISGVGLCLGCHSGAGQQCSPERAGGGREVDYTAVSVGGCSLVACRSDRAQG